MVSPAFDANNILEHIGIPTAPEALRIKFLKAFAAQSRELLEAGAHRPHVIRVLREVVYYHWERPQLKKYASERRYSVAAWKYRDAATAERRRMLRYDHAVPMKLVSTELLNPKADIENILREKVHGVIITADEDRKLSESGLRQSMPPGWQREGGEPFARYKAAGIKLRPAR